MCVNAFYKIRWINALGGVFDSVAHLGVAHLNVALLSVAHLSVPHCLVLNLWDVDRPVE